MKSDVIHVKNSGAGFNEALEQAELVAKFKNLPAKSALHLRLLTEEMMGMMHALTGQKEADFWIEDKGDVYSLHLSVETLMTAEKRRQLLAASKSGSNTKAKGFTGKLRDLFEEAILGYPDDSDDGIPDEVYKDLVVHPAENPEWDEFEQSVLRSVADKVKIAIRGDSIDMTVSKSFG